MMAQMGQISCTREHVVHFYDCDDELAATVGEFLADGARAGAVSVVIATEPHRLAFEAEMRAAGIDVERLRRAGALVSLDAAGSLAGFMRGGRIDPAAFRAVVGGVIGRAVRSGRPVQAYGEMVALLWEAGDVLAAIELEKLWNQLCDELHFSLLCAYKSESVAGHEHDALCQLHTEVLGESEAAFEPELDAPSAARRFVARVLAERGHNGVLLDDAKLVVSELATNVLLHARTPFSVLVRPGPTGVRIAVSDRSPAQPQIQNAGPAALSGRGLQLVDAVSRSWGIQPKADGKIIWAELRAV